MMPYGKGSIKFKVLVMQICAGSNTQVILRMTKNLKYMYKQAIANSKLPLSVFSRASLQMLLLLCSVLHMDGT